MKLIKKKKKQSFTKEPKIKIKNQKNKDWSRNFHKLEDNTKILHDRHKFQKDERKRKEGKRKWCGWWTLSPSTTCGAYKKKGHSIVFNDTAKMVSRLSRSITHVIQNALVPSTPASHFLFFINFYFYANIKLPLSWPNNS